MLSVDTRNVVELSDASIIARGSERTCYIYPGQTHKCIKVRNSDSSYSKQQQREEKYFSRLRKRKIPWEHTPAYYGPVDTSLGRGLVFSLVRDFDGRISKNLADTIKQGGVSDIGADLQKLKVFFYKWSILTCDMNLTNFLVQWMSPDKKRLVMIDGLGNREFIPISEICAFMSAVKMRRRWRRFDRKLEQLYLTVS